MAKDRTVRLNSLLREVLSETLRKEVRHPDIDEMVIISRVEITKDLHYAKVFVSVIGDDAKRNKAVKALNTSAGFISVTSSKKVKMRYFPSLDFRLDTDVDKRMRVEEVLNQIQEERDARNPSG